MQRILIIKVGALGDLIIAIPHIRQIIENNPQAKVWLLTAPAFTSFFEDYPFLEVKPFPRHGIRAFLAALSWVRNQRFEGVFDLQGSDRSKTMTALSGAVRRYGLGPGFPYTHCPPNKGIVGGKVHSFNRLNRLLEAAGLPPASTVPYLEANTARRQVVSAWLEKQRLQGRELVLIHAGSSRRWESKRWMNAHFITLATALEHQGLAVIWVGSPEDAALNRVLSQAVGVDATAAFSLLELAELARRARFAVTTDSAPMHVMAAAGLPVYALFGPTDWRRSHGLGQEARVLFHQVSCSPCFLPQCPPERAHRCLAELKPETVLARLRRDGWF